MATPQPTGEFRFVLGELQQKFEERVGPTGDIWDPLPPPSVTWVTVQGTGNGQPITDLVTTPGPGGHPITNIFWDPATNKLEGEYDDASNNPGQVVSSPPGGTYPVTNVWFDPLTGRMVGQYDDGT